MTKQLVFSASAILCVTFAAFAAKFDLNRPTGTQGIFMVDKVGAHLRFFDAAGEKEIANFATPNNPHDFVFSADHKLAYVPIYGDGVYGRNPHPGHEVLIVDLKQHKLLASIDIAPHRAPHGIQLGKSGLIYVTCDLDRKILVIDPKTRAIKDTLDTEGTGHWIGLLPDESKIYVTNKKDKLFVTVIDLKQKKIVERIPVATGTEGIAVSPDGKTVVVMDSGEPMMTVIDPQTDKVTAHIALKNHTKNAYKAYFSPNGKLLLTMNMADRVGLVFDAANLSGEQKAFSTGKDPMGYAFSADGKTALIANHGDGSVGVLDLKTLQVVRTFHAGTGIETLGYY